MKFSKDKSTGDMPENLMQEACEQQLQMFITQKLSSDFTGSIELNFKSGKLMDAVKKERHRFN